MLYLLENLLYCTLSGIILFFFLLILYYQSAFNYWKKKDIPHIKPKFPLGNMSPNFSKTIGQSIASIYHEMKKQGHTYCGYYLFASPIFMPISPEMNKYFLTTNFNCFADRGFVSDEKNDPMGSSLITWHGEKWRRMREKLSPTWSAGKTKMMLPIVLKCSEDLEEVIQQHARKGEPINLHDIAKRYTVDVICSCAFGVTGGCLKNPNSEFVRHAKMVFTTKIVDNLRMAITMSAPVIAKMFKIQLFNPTASSFFRKVVYDTVNYREQNGIERQDFLNLMIRLKNNMSIKDGEERTKTIINDDSEEITMDNVASQCFLFFIAGFETTSASIQFMMYELAKNAYIQDNARANVKDTMARNNGELSYESVREMRYLENVFYETVRKYPTVHMLNRACTEDFTIPGTDIVIEKGTKAVLTTLGIHMDPEFYPDPEKFDPDRFTDEEKAKRPAYVYLPFGDGPRICPGLRFGVMEVKLCIASLLLKFKFSLHPKSETIQLCSLGNVIGTEEPILIYAEPL